MAWASAGTRSLTILVLLPVITPRLTPAELSVWFVFASLIALQTLADLGFSPTLVRMYAFAAAGVKTEELGRVTHQPGRSINWETAGSIWRTAQVVYARLTAASIVGIALIGTALVWRPILSLTEPSDGWIAWTIVLAVSGVVVRGNIFSSYLQGLNHVALVRRWEALTTVGSVLSSAAVVLLGGRLLALVATHQAWMLVNVARNRWLARRVNGGALTMFPAGGIDRSVIQIIWPAAWRSGIGAFFGQAPIHLSTLAIAQIGEPRDSASLLLALSVLSAIRGFSMGPLYSKLPLLARLRAEGNLDALARVSRRGMQLSYGSFVLPALVFGVLGHTLLRMVGSNTQWVPNTLWALLILGMLLERYGAMHLQVYSTTNHIFWHVINGATAVLYAVTAVALYPFAGLYAFGWAYVLAHAFLYAPVSAHFSYKSLRINPFEFELRAAVLPLCIVIAYAILAASGSL